MAIPYSDVDVAPNLGFELPMYWVLRLEDTMVVMKNECIVLYTFSIPKQVWASTLRKLILILLRHAGCFHLMDLHSKLCSTHNLFE